MASNNALNQTSPNFTVNQITISNAPVVGTDGTNKTYVDMIAAGFQFKNATVAGTTVALTVTYANGTAGVGATLTNAGVQAAFSVDGVSPAINSRILVKNQASTFQNGIYTLTTVGTGASNWVLTRATDYDTVAEIKPGDIVPIQTGTVNATTLWLQTATVVTIGTDPILFSQFFGGGIHSVNGDVGAATAANGVITLTGGTTGAVFTGSGSSMTMSFAGITANAGTVSLGTDATDNAINIGTAASAGRTTTVGNATGTSSLLLRSGSGALSVTSTGGALTINSGVGALAISNDASATTVTIATGAAVKTTTLGSTNSTSATTVQSGSGALAVTSTGGALTINSGVGALGVSTDASATTVSLATGGAVKTVTLGSTNSTSVTTIACGTGGCNVGTSANAHATVVGSTTAAATTTIQAPSAGVILTGVQGVVVANKNYVTINTATGAIGSDAGASSSISITGDTGGALTGSSFTFTGGTTGLSFGGSGSTETLTFAGITANGGTVSLATDATTSTVNIGTGAGAKTVTLGSTNTTSTTVIKSGSGNVTINSGLTIDSSGRNYNTVQPAFSAYVSSQQSNVTGDGTTATMIADTELFDQGSNYNNTTGVFTAPITGRYFFNSATQNTDVIAQTSGYMQITATSHTFVANFLNAAAVTSAQNLGLQVSAFVNMTAGDTCKAEVTYSGSTKTVDIGGNSYFSGYLVC